MTRAAKVGTTMGLSVVVTAACLMLVSLLGRYWLTANIVSMKLFFPFFGLSSYLYKGQPGPSAPLLFLLVYFQFPLYAILVSRGWLTNRLRNALIAVALIHLSGLAATFGAPLF